MFLWQIMVIYYKKNYLGGVKVRDLVLMSYMEDHGIPGQIKPRIIAKQAAIRSKTKD